MHRVHLAADRSTACCTRRLRNGSRLKGQAATEKRDSRSTAC
jgi:hypothetical protein